MCRCRRLVPSCRSRPSRSATSADQPSSPRTWPFEDWTSVLGSERLTGALLDRLTHHVHIMTMNGYSCRLKQSARRRRAETRAEQNQATSEIIDPDIGEITPS